MRRFTGMLLLDPEELPGPDRAVDVFLRFGDRRIDADVDSVLARRGQPIRDVEPLADQHVVRFSDERVVDRDRAEAIQSLEDDLDPFTRGPPGGGERSGIPPLIGLILAQGIDMIAGFGVADLS